MNVEFSTGKAVELLFTEELQTRLPCSGISNSEIRIGGVRRLCRRVGRLCRQAHLQEQQEGVAASLITCAVYNLWSRLLSSLYPTFPYECS